MQNRYGFGKAVDMDFDSALKKKLNAEMRPYRILGACNPPFAQRAIAAEPSIGLLLPCNVVVREDEAGKVQVEFMDPGLMVQLIDKPEVHGIAADVRARLQRVFAAL